MERHSLPPQLKEGCVLFIPGEVDVITAYDASGNGNHLTRANSPEMKRRHGYKGHSFNGSSFLYRGDAAGVTDHYTFSCSVKMNAELGGGDVMFMHLGNTAGGNIFDSAIQYHLNAGTLYLRHFRNKSGVTFDYVDVAYTIGTEKFSRIAITFDGSACRTYVNGTKVMDFASSGFGTNPSVGTQMSIARYFNGDTTFSRPNAQIFNPLIATRAFSDDEIRLDALTFFIP